MTNSASAPATKIEHKAPFFDSQTVETSNEYVAWIDALGTKSALMVSHARATNFVMKVHAATLDAKPGSELALFPMNDGVFVKSKNWNDLHKFLIRLFRILAVTFSKEENHRHQFLVRGAVAFGSLSVGTQLTGKNKSLIKNEEYIKGVILGMPLAQAVEAERNAPPFGIIIHESARAFAPAGEKPLCFVLWRWWNEHKPDDVVNKLKLELTEYFKWAERNSTELQYPADSRQKHFASIQEYFNI